MKLNRKQTLRMAIVLAAATLPASSLHAAIGQRPPTALLEDTTTPLASSWNEIWERLRRKEVPGGSRGDRNQAIVCSIVPGMLIDRDTEETSSLQVWGLNPVFVWQEEWSHLEVLHSQTHEVLLSQELDPEARHLGYSNVENAIPLDPGGSYYWRLSRDGSDGQTAAFGETSFRMLDEVNRLELEAALTDELAEVDSSEHALIKRMSFFADRGLWADVFRELHTADELPANLEAFKEEIAGHDFCAQSRALSRAHSQSALH